MNYLYLVIISFGFILMIFYGINKIELIKKFNFFRSLLFIVFSSSALFLCFIMNNNLLFGVYLIIISLLYSFLISDNILISFIKILYLCIMNIAILLLMKYSTFICGYTIELFDYKNLNISSLFFYFGFLFLQYSVLQLKVIINLYNTIKDKSKIIILLFLTCLLFSVYELFNSIILILLIVVFILLLLFLYYKNEYEKIKIRYIFTQKNIAEYERIINEYRINNHENKNLLLTIRNLLLKENDKSLVFIDKLIGNSVIDDPNAMYYVNKIPCDGLRAVVYSKLLSAKNSNIELEIKIDSNIKTMELSNDLHFDLCNLISIYLDNAIEASKDTKDKKVSLNMESNDEYITITISNSYVGEVNLDLIDSIEYSIKGYGHGYGLSLASKIICNNKSFLHETNIANGKFIQILKFEI